MIGCKEQGIANEDAASEPKLSFLKFKSIMNKPKSVERGLCFGTKQVFRLRKAVKDQASLWRNEQAYEL